jgi:hypothetical protein
MISPGIDSWHSCSNWTITTVKRANTTVVLHGPSNVTASSIPHVNTSRASTVSIRVEECFPILLFFTSQIQLMNGHIGLGHRRKSAYDPREPARQPRPPSRRPKRTVRRTNLSSCEQMAKNSYQPRFTFQSNYFDLVHSQMMAGGIHANRWRSYIRDIFRVTRPGGWCQMVEIYFNAQSDNGSLTRGKNI